MTQEDNQNSIVMQ